MKTVKHIIEFFTGAGREPEMPGTPFRDHPAIIAAREEIASRPSKPEHFGKRVKHEPGKAPPPGHAWIGDYSAPLPQARANAWKTHQPDTLRAAISYTLQTALANGDSYAIEWLRQWSEGEPSALAELRTVIQQGEA